MKSCEKKKSNGIIIRISLIKKITDKMIQQRNNVLTKHECEGMDVIGCLVYIGGPIGMAGFTEDRDDGMEEVPRSSARFVG